jgi:osmoprotectant transport system permease protein
MTFLDGLAAWLADPAHWTGPDGMVPRLLEHLALSATCIALAFAIALPIGLAIGHTGRGATATISVANIGRALPTLGVLGIILPLTANIEPYGFDLIPSVVALVALAIPPIVTNTYAGLREVDPEAIEAGRGMGMRELQLLRQVEIPLAIGSILAGLRVSAVQVVATATLAAVLGAGGLGRLIIDGIAQHDDPQLFMGAVLVAILAIATELTFALLQRVAVSPGLRASAGVREIAGEPMSASGASGGN